MAQHYRLERGSIQERFHHMTAPVQVFGGGFGNGKTTAAVMKALRLVIEYPGCNGLIARESYPKLKDTIEKEFFKWCPKSWIRRMPTIEDNTCYLNNGSVVNFRYIQQRGKSSADGHTTSNLLSASFDWIIVDQMEDPGIQYKDFLDLIGRLRGQTAYRPSGEHDPAMPPTGPRFIIMTANPSQGWFYKEIVQPFLMWRDRGVKTEHLLWDEHVGKPIVDLVEGSTYTNAANLPTDYLRNLESAYKGQMRERFLMGKWAAFEGLVYGDFDLTTHVLTQSQVENYLWDCKQRHVRLRAVEAYDFGITSPTCYGLAAVDDYGRVILVDGFYTPNLPYNHHRTNIEAVRAKFLNVLDFGESILADPAIWMRTVVKNHVSEAGTTIASLLEDDGLRIRPAENSKLTGIAKVASYMAMQHEIPHPLTGESPAPLLYVSETCEWWTDEVTNYYWQRNPQQQYIDEPMNTADHAMDMTKYMFTDLPEASKIILPRSKQFKQWLRWHEVDNAHAMV